MFELVFLSGPKAGVVVPIDKPLVAGRSPECSLEVPDPNASRQHARIQLDGTGVVFTDNNSSNGTWVNDQRISSVIGKPGDVLRLGETRLRLQQRQAANNEEVGSSSVFGFKEIEADLSQSIVMPVTDAAPTERGPEVIGQRLAAVLKVSKALVNISNLDQVLNDILDTLFEVFPQADRGFIMLGAEVSRLEAKAIRQRSPRGDELPTVSNSICRRALTTRSAFIFNEGAQNDFDQGLSIVSLKIRSAMTVPLMVESEIQGLVQIDTPDRNRAFTAEDLELALAIAQTAAIAIHNAKMLKRLERETTTRQNLCRFLPGPLAEQAMAGQLDLGLGGRTYPGTVLFSDVVGFTRLTELLPPGEVVALMNGYFDRMVPTILRDGGAIDKFIGDAIMAFWGVPIDRGDSTLHACAAGLGMQIALIGFNSLQAARGKTLLSHGIGINSGPVVAGNIGSSSSQISYTLLGDTVNTASRIEHAANPGQVLIAHDTMEQLGGRGFGLRMPPLSARNKSEPLQVFSLRGLKHSGEEIVLYLPATSGPHAVVLIRRLSDQSFIALHPQGCDLGAADLITAVAEWPKVVLGRPQVTAVLPTQAGDGHLLRGQFKLADPTLAGLISNQPLTCPVGWDALVR